MESMMENRIRAKKTEFHKRNEKKVNTTSRVKTSETTNVHENGKIVSMKFVFFIRIRWIEKCHITNFNPHTVNFIAWIHFDLCVCVCVQCILCNTPSINDLRHGISTVQFPPFFCEIFRQYKYKTRVTHTRTPNKYYRYNFKFPLLC